MPVQTYTIAINAQQLALLTQAMQLLSERKALYAMSVEVDYLTDLLAELPQIEKDHPGVIHNLYF